jgi:hypothetical protein
MVVSPPCSLTLLLLLLLLLLFRYIAQLEREELSRSRALAQLRKEIAADARHGRSYKQGGGLANRLVSAWLPLVAQAIEEEQVQVRGKIVVSRAAEGRGEPGSSVLTLVGL